MSCNHDCNQGRRCTCQMDTQSPTDLDKADKEDTYLLVAFLGFIVAFIIWSLI